MNTWPLFQPRLDQFIYMWPVDSTLIPLCSYVSDYVAVLISFGSIYIYAIFWFNFDSILFICVWPVSVMISLDQFLLYIYIYNFNSPIVLFSSIYTILFMLWFHLDHLYIVLIVMIHMNIISLFQPRLYQFIYLRPFGSTLIPFCSYVYDHVSVMVSLGSIYIYVIFWFSFDSLCWPCLCYGFIWINLYICDLSV